MKAIVSDLHSNREAIHRVLEDARAQGATEIGCLGDVIGYGPEPIEAVRVARQFRFCLRGNHEDALLNRPIGFNRNALLALEWTERQLRESRQTSSEGRELWRFLERLEAVVEEDGALFLHASPRDPITEYVLPLDARNPVKMREIFDRIPRVAFGGHTHLPGVFTEDGRFLSPRDLEGVYRLEKGGKAFVNVGSVGQPRDGDRRSCYVLYDGETIRFRRVEYDFRRTLQRILDTPALPSILGYRLEAGR